MADTQTVPEPAAYALSFLASHGIRPVRWWVFGTDPACHVQVVDDYAAKFHTLAFEYPAGGYMWVMDLGSLNGTWLTVCGGQRRRLEQAWERIRPGDTLRIGRTDLPWRTP